MGQRAESLGESLSEVETRFDLVETSLTLQPAYRQLSERDRRLVYLRFYSELSQREIADEFGVSQMQISRWLVRVLRSLRQYLSEDDEQVALAEDFPDFLTRPAYELGS